MTIEGATYAALSPIAPTYPLVASQTQAPPRIVYTMIAGTWVDTISDGAPAHMEVVQIDVWSTSYADAKAKALQAQAALRNGLIVGQVKDNPDRYELDTKLFCVSFDVDVWESP